MKIAEVFGKRHANVLRDIKSLDCSEAFNELNFELVNYLDEKGELRPKYFITQDGFTFLAMGYNGKDAAMFKESYIREFNHMRDQLAQRSPANDYLNMSDEDRAIAYFMKVKAEKAQYLILVYGLSSY
ncbi:putative phage regulatory protein Rha family [Paenibacillus sp. FSL R7-277]|nr:putative phage regulatory protein Rha family [Paenibacillus sp. FSL R7-277]